MTQKRIFYLLIFILLAELNISCSGCSSTVSYSIRESKKEEPQQEEPQQDDPPAELQVFGQDSSFEFVSALNSGFAWVVTKPTDTKMNVYRIKIDSASGYETKKWTIENSSLSGAGNRTSVSEIGLLIGKRGGYLFRVSEDMATETTITTPIWTALKPMPQTRACVVSYKKDASSFIGVGWEDVESNKKFTEIPIDLTKANKIGAATDHNQGTKIGAYTNPSWSYSCFFDHNRKYFWGYIETKDSFAGFDVSKKKALTISDLPNYKKGSSNNYIYTDEKIVSGSGPYTIAGDANGNILAGLNMYTYTHEARYGHVFASSKAAPNNVFVADTSCFSSDATCTESNGKMKTFSSTASLGPLSSLNDGRVIGISRGTNSVYVLELKNPQDISEGINMTLIKNDLEGDPYMYSDFTGSTLSQKKINLTISLDELEGYSKGKPIQTLYFKWIEQNSKASGSPWKGIRLLARCYKNGATQKPDFEEISAVQNSGTVTEVTATSCKGSAADRLDFQTQPLTTSSDFSRTESLSVFGYQ